MDPMRLTDLQLDAVGEVGSIGAGHAATALSQLLGGFVDIDVPIVRILPFSDVPGVFGGPENLVGAVYSRLLGDLTGGMLFVVSREGLLCLADLLCAREPGTARSVGAEEEALVTRTASVLHSAYLAAITQLTGLSVIAAPAQFAFDMIGAILEVVTSEVGMKADTAVLLMTRFHASDVEIDAALFYLPDPDSLDVLLGRLGIV